MKGSNQMEMQRIREWENNPVTRILLNKLKLRRSQYADMLIKGGLLNKPDALLLIHEYVNTINIIDSITSFSIIKDEEIKDE